MYSILLVVEKPDLSHPENERKWDEWKDKTAGISKRYTNLKALGESVLLIPLQNSLSSLRYLLNHLEGMDYKYALFDTEIQWHEVTKGS